jgi:orotate phosphoribosyltransferase
MPGVGDHSDDTKDLIDRVVAILRSRGYEHRSEPFRLASGVLSHDYVDCRRALSSGDALMLACHALVAHAERLGIAWDAVGGLTMGADPLSHGMAILTERSWFSVRKEAKEHGRARVIEGCEVGPGVRAIIVEDVVTTGGSALKAVDAVDSAGGEVVLVSPLLDRGNSARTLLSGTTAPYAPLLTYLDLGIDPVS